MTRRTSISRTQAINLINNSKGRRFTVTFIKNTNGEIRTLNGSRYNQTPLGNITMSIPNKGYRSFNPNNLLELRINGYNYTVK
jgi:hypothetical protein